MALIKKTLLSEWEREREGKNNVAGSSLGGRKPQPEYLTLFLLTLSFRNATSFLLFFNEKNLLCVAVGHTILHIFRLYSFKS
jgi:hypothetical protein